METGNGMSELGTRARRQKIYQLHIRDSLHLAFYRRNVTSLEFASHLGLKEASMKFTGLRDPQAQVKRLSRSCRTYGSENIRDRCGVEPWTYYKASNRLTGWC